MDRAANNLGRAVYINDSRSVESFIVVYADRSLLRIELLYETALVQFGHEARVHELLRFATTNLWPRLRDIVVGGFEPVHDRIRHGYEILPKYFVRAFQKFLIIGAQIFGENFHAEVLVCFKVGYRFDMGPEHAHHCIAVVL